MKRFLLLFLVILCGCTVVEQGEKSPKHIFYFIGDGMGFEQMKLTEKEPIFATFPIKGEVMTASQSDSITDSAAAGTALSTGSKTSNGTIAMDSTHTVVLSSLMVDAKKGGYMTAILTNVSLDHATPAAFYANSPSRNMYREISECVVNGGIDFYAGAGFRDLAEGQLEEFSKAGYSFLRGLTKEIRGGERVIWVQTEQKNQAQLPYALDRCQKEDMSLPGMLDSMIVFMTDSAFVVMIEGGLIDWAAHKNDTERTRAEVEDFDNAVSRALEFYEKNPNNTLIVVTADHETGGLSVDENGKATWSSTHHTAANVPIFAIGVGAEKFEGVMQNNEVALRLKEIITENKKK